jgi:Spy/CpxP family protein refolding chaperone
MSALAALTLLAGCASHSHYAGWEKREIKALSEADIAGLRAGRGMSLALAAELNGYPGPSHVLELADQLSLSPAQKAATEALFRRMQTTAAAAGNELIDAERKLDALFASGAAAALSVTEALSRVGAAQAGVRGAHLQAHLEQVRILTPQQVAEYNRLRGYGEVARTAP